jgi:SAM-dependent methyltransferase
VSESLLYRSEVAYALIMRGLYGRHYDARYRAVAELVPAGADVLDVCCGPAILYRRYLRRRNVAYRGLDVSGRFVQRLRRIGLTAEVWDVSQPRALPRADVVIMQASLYHFLADPHPVIDRLRAAARDKVIISEPVRNLTSSRVQVLAALGRRATRIGSAGTERFDEPMLDSLMQDYAPAVRERVLIPGGREKVYVLTGWSTPPDER